MYENFYYFKYGLVNLVRKKIPHPVQHGRRKYYQHEFLKVLSCFTATFLYSIAGVPRITILAIWVIIHMIVTVR